MTSLATIISSIISNNPSAVLSKMHNLGIGTSLQQIDYYSYQDEMSRLNLGSLQQSIDVMVETLDVPIIATGPDADLLYRLEYNYQASLTDVVRAFVTQSVTGASAPQILPTGSPTSINTVRKDFKTLSRDQQVVLGFAMIGFIVSLLFAIKLIIQIGNKIID